MPRPENSSLFSCFQAWRPANNIQGLFLAGLIYGLLCRVL